MVEYRKWRPHDTVLAESHNRSRSAQVRSKPSGSAGSKPGPTVLAPLSIASLAGPSVLAAQPVGKEEPLRAALLENATADDD